MKEYSHFQFFLDKIKSVFAINFLLELKVSFLNVKEPSQINFSFPIETGVVIIKISNPKKKIIDIENNI